MYHHRVPYLLQSACNGLTTMAPNVVSFLHGLSLTAANACLSPCLHYAARLNVASRMCYAPPNIKILCGNFNGSIPVTCLKSALIPGVLVMGTAARLSYQPTLSVHRCTSQPLSWIGFLSQNTVHIGSLYSCPGVGIHLALQRPPTFAMQAFTSSDGPGTRPYSNEK